MIPFAALLTLAGCDDTLFGQRSTSQTYTPDWPGMVAFVDDHCVRCHTPGGIASPEFPAAIAGDVLGTEGVYVVPGDPDASLLWRVVSDARLEGDPPVMPFGTGPLRRTQTDHVREWILAGALVEDTDADSDGFGLADGDCDDRDDTIWPGAPEVCDHVDNDCDGEIDEGLTTPGWADADGDGFGDPDTPLATCPGEGATNALDCDDTSDQALPGGTEICDGLDNDCDGITDPSTAAGAVPWYFDSDGDGFGDWTDTIDACEQPARYVDDDTDCDDTRSLVNPAASEVCNGLDDDCSGPADDGPPLDAPAWYRDQDRDGYGNPNDAVFACNQPVNRVADGRDCDDTDPTTYPSAPEPSCTDPVDRNCDGLTGSTDHDGDGFGACLECDDTDDTIFPGATERCDGEDQDCDGEVDNGASDALIWFADGDEDGFGGPTTVLACEQPLGATVSSEDCDDGDRTIFPGAAESCDGVDEDCDGTNDNDAFDTIAVYADIDGDGYGDPDAAGQRCPGTAGWTVDDSDCDDTDAAVSPDETTDPLDGIDNDCDGSIDEDAALTTSHATDIQPIWDARCTTACHAAAVPAGGLRLNGDAWPDLVNQPSGQAPMDRVEPFDPTTSYLWHKLNNTHLSAGGSGSGMPKTGASLTTTQLQLIETWILEGAPP